MSNQLRTSGQLSVIEQLTANFDIDAERILFLNPRDPNDPWIPPDELESIARQAGGFQSINIDYDNYVEQLKQVVFKATVVDDQGRIFGRPGVATIGEKTPVGEIDVQILAAGRALNAALKAAGFHPLKSGSVVSLDDRRATRQNQQLSTEQREQQAATDAAVSRRDDLKLIHAIAEEKNLIIRGNGFKNDKPYRDWLFRNFSVSTAVELNAAERASVINQLRLESAHEISEEEELALIA